MANYTVPGLKSYYIAKWNNMQITRPQAIELATNIVMRGVSRYKEIEKLTGVPWKVIGIIHLRESNCNFATHLHNGDSLNARTWHVPAGRPLRGNAPFTFEASAVDALTMQRLTTIKSWPIEQIAYTLEAYNGWGYRMRGVPSAYLWSGTNQYSSGKYIADGVWDAGTVDVQVGTMAVLKRLMEKTGEPASATTEVPPPITSTTVPQVAVQTSDTTYKAAPPKPTTREMAVVSRKFFLTEIMAWIVKGVAAVVALIQALTIAQVEATAQWVSAIKTFTNENTLFLGALVLIGVGLYLTVIQKWTKDDVTAGRYSPSGALPVAPAIAGHAGVPEAIGSPVVVPDAEMPAADASLPADSVSAPIAENVQP